jgi:hypothetical protein
MLTYSGNYIDVANIQPEQLNLQDICRSLSLQCRWNGHLGKFYSVAQHSMVLAEACRILNYCPDACTWALCHDFSEAYFSDVPLPIKRNPNMKWFVQQEKQLGDLIFNRFVTPEGTVARQTWHEAVDGLDKALAVVEYEVFAEYLYSKSDEVFQSTRLDEHIMGVLTRALYKVSGISGTGYAPRCWGHEEAHTRIKLECRTWLT